MRFIISKKADVRFLKTRDQDAVRFGEDGKGEITRRMTVFTDAPLEERRKLEVTIAVSSSQAGLAARMTAPIEANVDLEYNPGDKPMAVRYEFDVNLDEADAAFLGILTEPVTAVRESAAVA